MVKISGQTAWYMSFFCWFVSLTGIAGSLYFSEVLNYLPCVLCWYQRIFLYPVFFIISVGVLKRDFANIYYVIPLALTGLLVSVYHNLIFYKLISEEFTPCQSGISCSEQQLDWLGFVSIPLLSMLGFTAVTAVTLCQIYLLRNNRILHKEV